jgi:NTP pyrophosphatase (non-canonical NTP hydrolase)
MNQETLKQLQKEIHANARAKGWWDTERDMDEIFANFHAEVSEAWEEWRKGNSPDLIYFMTLSGCYSAEMKDMMRYAAQGHKPEGIPIELADLVIRILDAAEGEGWEIKLRTAWAFNLPTLVLTCHAAISKAARANMDENTPEIAHRLSNAVNNVAASFEAIGMDLEQTIRLKMAYNATREYRHGNKRA